MDFRTYLEEFAEVNEVELVLVCETELLGRARNMLKQVLDVLVVFTCFQRGLVVNHDFDLRGVSAKLLALGLVDINVVEDLLVDFKGEFFACLNQLVRVHVYRQFFEAKGGNHLDNKLKLLRFLRLLQLFRRVAQALGARH